MEHCLFKTTNERVKITIFLLLCTLLKHNGRNPASQVIMDNIHSVSSKRLWHKQKKKIVPQECPSQVSLNLEHVFCLEDAR